VFGHSLKIRASASAPASVGAEPGVLAGEVVGVDPEGIDGALVSEPITASASSVGGGAFPSAKGGEDASGGNLQGRINNLVTR
jgi:hypothetical protein